MALVHRILLMATISLRDRDSIETSSNHLEYRPAKRYERPAQQLGLLITFETAAFGYAQAG